MLERMEAMPTGKPAMRVLSFMLPGKAKAFRVHELEAAKNWLAAED